MHRSRLARRPPPLPRTSAFELLRTQHGQVRQKVECRSALRLPAASKSAPADRRWKPTTPRAGRSKSPAWRHPHATDRLEDAQCGWSAAADCRQLTHAHSSRSRLQLNAQAAVANQAYSRKRRFQIRPCHAVWVRLVDSLCSDQPIALPAHCLDRREQKS